MFTASEELRQRFAEMSEQDLLTAFDKVGLMHARHKRGQWEISFHRGSTHSQGKHPEKSEALRHHIDQFIEMALQTKHTAPATFDSLCRDLGILNDDARSLDYQRIASSSAADAARSASISADAAASSERHAATANRIAEKSNRLSFWSVVVAIGAALIALVSLLVAIFKR